MFTKLVGRIQHSIWLLLLIQILLFGEPEEFYADSCAPSTSNSFKVDIFKQQKHHLQSSVSDLKDKLSSAHLSDSMHELWERVQTEANEYKITPQEALIRSVKRCSFVLNDYLKKLKQQTSEVPIYFTSTQSINAICLDSTYRRCSTIGLGRIPCRGVAFQLGALRRHLQCSR